MKKTQRILVVDGSRVVRASLAKHLGGEFEVLEEANAESAWQVLMLDHSISVVVAGLNASKLEVADLPTRLRSSSIRRLRDMPLVLIVSEQVMMSEDARARKANGFITKTMKRAEIMACLRSVLEPVMQATAEPGEQERILPAAQMKKVVAGLVPADEMISMLVFGIDGRDDLIARFGQEAAVRIEERFASLVAAKIGATDLIGRQDGERLVVVTRGADLHQAARFGKKVCKRLASGQIALRGEKVGVTASVGIASTSDDSVANGGQLLALASQRLDQASVCGGNTVVTEFRAQCPGHCPTQQTAAAVAFALKTLATDEQAQAIPKGEMLRLGRELLPLLKAMDRELALKLPLAHIARQLEAA